MAGMRIGVLGGTFDPVHIGHLVLAEEARLQVKLDRVIFVPAGDPWRKANRPISPAEHRVAMLRRAVADNPAFEVSTIEVEREGPSYTADTLEALVSSVLEARWYFIVGADALLDLTNWHEPRRIIAAVRLLVANRAGSATPSGFSLSALERKVPGIGERIDRVAMPRIDVSATEMRFRLTRGESVRYLVPDAVAQYAREQGVYGTLPG